MAKKLNLRLWMSWLAVILGLMTSVFFVIFIIGLGIWYIMQGKTGSATLISIVSAGVLGYILALFKPKAAGWLMVLAGIVAGGYLVIVGDKGILLMASLYALPFIVPGMLFIRFRK